MNSADLLNVINTLSGATHHPAPDIDIEMLRQRTGQSLPALIAMLTELENSDKVQLNVSVTSATPNAVKYSGTVKLIYPDSNIETDIS